MCVIVRSIYRTVELLQGWTGYLITTQRCFVALDGIMMLIAVGVFNFTSPRWTFVEEPKQDRESESGHVRIGSDQTFQMGLVSNRRKAEVEPVQV